MHGRGLLTHINGDTFEGIWIEGKKGKGTYRTVNGFTFQPKQDDNNNN